MHGDKAPWLQQSEIAFALHDEQKLSVPTANKPKWPRRPPRLGRVFSNIRSFYFVTFNTYKRQTILARPEVHATFCTFSSKAQQHGIAVGRYVIMPDHVHLFVAFPIVGMALPDWVQSLRTVMGKRLLRLNVHKPHWQEGFFDRLLRTQESYAEKWEYVRQNPVRAGLCERPEDWPYEGEIVPILFD